MHTIRSRLAEFFDMFYIGEGETVSMMLFLICYKAEQGSTAACRTDFLYAAAQIPGIYVPSLYDVTYKEDGTIASFTPNERGCAGDDHQVAGYGHDHDVPVYP